MLPYTVLWDGSSEVIAYRVHILPVEKKMKERRKKKKERKEMRKKGKWEGGRKKERKRR